MRARHPLEEPEDTTAQAGWMYADLFLALMVVFLATISFVPQTFSGSKDGQPLVSQGETVYSYSQIYDQRLDILFDRYDFAFLESEINKFSQKNSFAPGSEIVFVQIIAGYNPQIEQSPAAIDRALKFSLRIDESSPALLKNASTTLSSTSTIKPGQVVLQLTFATRVAVTK